jgi:hypothetical protein
MNINWVCNVAYFEVIEIVDDIHPYPSLMGFQWAFDNQEIINMKRREMIFDVGDLKVTTPLDLTKGKRYIEPVRGNEIDNLYKIRETCKSRKNNSQEYKNNMQAKDRKIMLKQQVNMSCNELE